MHKILLQIFIIKIRLPNGLNSFPGIRHSLVINYFQTRSSQRRERAPSITQMEKGTIPRRHQSLIGSSLNMACEA